MTFEEWYELQFPDIDPIFDDFLYGLKSAYEAGYKEGKAHVLGAIDKILEVPPIQG